MGKDRDRELHAQEHLRENQSLEWVANQENDAERRYEREQDTQTGVRVGVIIGLVEEAGEDGGACDAGSDGGRDTRQQESCRENHARVASNQWHQELLGLIQLVHGDVFPEERGGGEDNHRRVDGPADDHRQERVVELVFQLPLDNGLVLQVPRPALDDLGVQEQVVWHHDRPQHAHDDEHGVFRKGRFHPARNGLSPVDIYERKLIEKRETDDGDEGDNPTFYFIIGITEQHGKTYDRHDNSAYLDWHAE